jgi:subtilisin family serine protease
MPALNLSVDDLSAAAQAGSDSTGRKIIVFAEAASRSEIDMALAGDGGAVLHSSELGEESRSEALAGASALVFDELNIALVTGDEEIPKADGRTIIAVEPDRLVFALYEAVAETQQHTWGLVATRVPESPRTGRGIKVAVLDTGFAPNHPDFAGRQVVRRSFIDNETPEDGNGHGTHCIGTACGGKTPAGVPRYGIAFESLIYAGKVLSNSGSGSFASVLAGIDWAVANRCEVISMSLGAGGGPYAQFTQAGARALAAGCLIVAAAGNESRRPGHIAPTGAPANSPTVVSVAALNSDLSVAYFSCGGKIEIAAPGVGVFSSLPLPRRHGTLSGTSMATPHVAGIAALWAESDARYRADALKRVLMSKARQLPTKPASDVGAGLVQAPVPAAT